MIIEGTLYDSRRDQPRWQDTIEVSDNLSGPWQQMQDHHCIITVELLHNAMEGRLSVCIEDTDVEDDYQTRLIVNDPDHPEKMTALLEEMIGSFDPEKHEKWAALVREEQELPQDMADLDRSDE